MKIIKLMALAAILMPLLFSCSGGGSSAGMLGQLPDKYAQFTEEKAELKKEAENIKTEADKKRFLEKSEKLNKNGRRSWKLQQRTSTASQSSSPSRSLRLRRPYLSSSRSSQAVRLSHQGSR